MLSPADTLVLFLAASLAKPLQPVLDSYAARTGTVVQRESGASLEHARKITELHRIPDVLMLADADVFPQLLVPKYASWYAEFARNRMVVAYTPRSRHAAEISQNSWPRILRAKDVEVGRTDPNLAPVGYRTMLMLKLAQKFYREPGLANALLANAPPRNMRANAAELAALLSSGELDYIYDYQSVAEANGFRFVTLPPQIDLSDPARARLYDGVSVRVRGSTGRDSVEFHGAPIVYGLSIPRNAPHARAALAFLEYLESPAVLARLRAAHVDMLDGLAITGTGAPAPLRRSPSAPRR
jgi:molybdate/tungstate transport system substrate-binding protein